MSIESTRGDEPLYRLTDEQVACDLDGESVILHTGTGKYFGLNATGARIWAHLESPIRPREIVRRLVDEFEVSETECAREVRELLAELETHGLVRSS